MNPKRISAQGGPGWLRKSHPFLGVLLGVSPSNPQGSGRECNPFSGGIPPERRIGCTHDLDGHEAAQCKAETVALPPHRWTRSLRSDRSQRRKMRSSGHEWLKGTCFQIEMYISSICRRPRDGSMG